MKRFFTVVAIMLLALFQPKAQERLVYDMDVLPASIILITDADRDDEQYQFLVNQGFNVVKFWPGNLSGAGQDTIDMLNEADLVIIGRSPNSGGFDAPDKEFWNDLTVPVILNAQYIARSNRINWFNSTGAFHANEGPPVAYGQVSVPGDPIFQSVELMGDSVPWMYPPHDFLDLDSATNGEILVRYADTVVLAARFDAGVEFYNGAGDMPAGPRTYFGFGNDDTDQVNFFPLTKQAKTIYLAEIYRLLDQDIVEPVFAAGDNRIILATDDDQDDQQYEFLVRQGFQVTKFWPGKLSGAGQDTIDMLNAADLVIIGRSPNSGDFRSPDKEYWNDLTVPVILNAQYIARSNRINWFNSTGAFHANEGPPVAYGQVSVPGDPIFQSVELMGDSLAWMYPPHDFLDLDSATNGEILVRYADTVVLVARFDAGVEFYDGAGDMPAGPRTYFGFGNDNAGWVNFFPLTREAKKVYVAEISRLLGIEPPEVVYGAADFNVIMVTDADRDDPQMKFLEKNGMRVTKFYPGNLSEAGQDTIDMLNSTDLVIIGRSPNSGDFDSPDKEAWNALTVPVILNAQYAARSNRINWFNSTKAFHANDAPEVAFGTATDTDDPIFFNVSLMGDSIDWCLPPHDFLGLDSATNGEIVATYADTVVLAARFETGVEFYPGAGDMPAGPRTYFGFGNDNAGPDNFFPLTFNAQQVYLNEISRMLGAEMSVVNTIDTDASLSSLEYSVAGAVLTPPFHSDSMEYTLQLTEGENVVDLTATPTSEFATVVGDSTIDVSAGAEITTDIVVTAENGNQWTYEVTVVPYATGVDDPLTSSAALKLYPNPAADQLYVVSDREITRVTIFNAVGKTVLDMSDSYPERIRVNISPLDPGLYLIRVENGGTSSMSKFFKE